MPVAEPAAVELVAVPRSGRVFETVRLPRFGDLSPKGRLRLDALTRYLQDVSGDDTADAGFADLMPWVVRRLVIETTVDAVFRERLTFRTWCSGIGGRWAERRISVRGDEGARLEAAVLWVHIDVDSGAPRKLGSDFLTHYEEAAQGRRVRARLQHDAAPPSGSPSRPWPLRFVDFDPLRHVNNAVSLAAVEDELARRPDLRSPLRVEVEYRSALDPGAEPVLATENRGNESMALWLTDAASGVVATTAVVRRA